MFETSGRRQGSGSAQRAPLGKEGMPVCPGSKLSLRAKVLTSVVRYQSQEIRAVPRSTLFATVP